MRNPLNKRLPRELKSEIGKYIVLFIFLAGMISIVSGFIVAASSMSKAYDESFDKYNIEDGNFELYAEDSDDLLKTIEDDEDVSIYPNYYLEYDTKEVDSTLRIFKNRKEVDKICLMDGALPATDSEIAIDRMYADNNDLQIGDTLTLKDKAFTISGLVALSDYSALFSSASDMMFDAVKFGVAIVTDDAFDAFGTAHLHYRYSWIYDNPPKDDNAAKEQSNDFLEALSADAAASMNAVTNYIPQYTNQAIQFTGDDIKGDNAGITVFLYCVCLCDYNQQHDFQRSECHRNAASIRLHQRGTDSALFDDAAFGDVGSGIDRKHLRIYRIERLCSLHVLRQLQPANLCDHLECRCVCKDDCYSADFDVPDEPVCSDEQAKPVPVEVHSSGLETASEEESIPPEQQDWYFEAVPDSCHFPEPAELYHDCDWNFVRKLYFDVWLYV